MMVGSRFEQVEVEGTARSPVKSRRTVIGSLALMLAALALPPLSASAQTAVLYEVTEAMTQRGRGEGRRVATAALLGTVKGGVLCPEGECSLTALATSRVDLATGRGSVHGTFKVVVQDGNEVDGPEQVVLDGSLVGRIDLSLAILGHDGKPESGDELPLGSLTGHWRVGKESPEEDEASAASQAAHARRRARAHGTLTGIFRLPFALAGTAAYLLDPLTFPAPGSFRFVQPEEHSLAFPTVRLEIHFKEDR